MLSRVWTAKPACTRLGTQYRRRAAVSLANSRSVNPVYQAPYSATPSSRLFAAIEQLAEKGPDLGETATEPASIEPHTTESRKRTNRDGSFNHVFTKSRFWNIPDEDVAAEIARSPFVPTARQYTRPLAMKMQAAALAKDARAQIGLRALWASHFEQPEKHHMVDGFTWRNIMLLVQNISPGKWRGRKMAAMRIVLPSEWGVDMDTRKIFRVNLAATVEEKLTVYRDHARRQKRTSKADTSSFVVRGERLSLSALSRRLLQKSKQIQIYELGDIETTDYAVKQLWPQIEDMDEATGSSAAEQQDKDKDAKDRDFWVHREAPKPYNLATRLEDIPIPLEWTQDSFDEYVEAVVCGQLVPEMAQQLYGADSEGLCRHERVDFSSIRSRLLMSAFLDQKAKPFITTPTFKMALNLISKAGGNRALAKELFDKVEAIGLPMDTEVYNIMLESYVLSRDVRFFYSFLRKMQQRYVRANARTWVLLLRLVKKDDARREIVTVMHKLGLFQDVNLRRETAAIMGPMHLHEAFQSQNYPADFMRDMTEKYGKRWNSTDAVHALLEEHFRLTAHSKLLQHQYASFLGKVTLGREGFETMIENAFLVRSWPLAIDALTRMAEVGHEPSSKIYHKLLQLCEMTACPSAAGMVFYHMVLTGHTRSRALSAIMHMLQGGSPSTPYWKYANILLMDKSASQQLKRSPAKNVKEALTGIIGILTRRCDGFRPSAQLVTDVRCGLSRDRDLRRQQKQQQQQQQSTVAPPLKIRVKNLATGKFDYLSLTHGFEDDHLAQGQIKPQLSAPADGSHIPPLATGLIGRPGNFKQGGQHDAEISKQPEIITPAPDAENNE
ncbi:uncharacterized protein J7T54_004766 [Emericellopsis cladophorae]|uniref:Pentatricopeptide repeat domain-containing protein n=1 Tax=Emericellopsis cladophorae TaxID=2686198 RepID=A0A9Q0BGZ6_9HYPO|nr:uncharacterized protein J7T54_004766 [Emericellopsis cladophorae]KAI6784220.1 hypothetical protein J7T54_004766 [Emericellopsis cladophorae]